MHLAFVASCVPGGCEQCSTLAVHPHTVDGAVRAELVEAEGRLDDVGLDQASFRQALDASPEGIAEEREYERRVVAPIEERQNALFRRIRETPATTAEGLLARIGMLAVSAPWRLKDACGDDGMIGAIIRDGLALSA